MPVYHQTRHWTEIFIGLTNDKILLSGATINDNWRIAPHVQSYCFCLSKKGLDIAIEAGIFRPEIEYSDKTMIIEGHEVALSREIIKRGFGIKCLLTMFKNANYSDFKREGIPPFVDVVIPGDKYNSTVPPPFWMAGKDDRGPSFQYNIHPYEVVFFKSNRGITPSVLESLVYFHNRNIGPIRHFDILFKNPNIIKSFLGL